jgi:hypothetical protein
MEKKSPIISIAVLCLLISTKAFSQKYYNNSSKGFTEIGIQGGFSGYRGDLGGTLGAGSKDLRDYDHRLPNIMVALNATYAMNRWLNFRPSLTMMQILGDDKSLSSGSASDKARYYRNLSFKSMIYEAAVLAEINPFYLIPKYAEKEEHRLVPYGTAGVGVFHFNPQGSLNGKWFLLQPLRTEGQGMEEYPERKMYKRTQLNIPLGVGFKYYITPSFYAGAEFLYRKTFTDYLDDVSTTYIEPALFDKYFTDGRANLARQLSYRSLTPTEYQPGTPRGSAKSKDAYYTFGVRVGISLGGLE